jgi:hypothetical protein
MSNKVINSVKGGRGYAVQGQVNLRALTLPRFFNSEKVTGITCGITSFVICVESDVNCRVVGCQVYL